MNTLIDENIIDIIIDEKPGIELNFVYRNIVKFACLEFDPNS